VGPNSLRSDELGKLTIHREDILRRDDLGRLLSDSLLSEAILSPVKILGQPRSILEHHERSDLLLEEPGD
jgi:hypothetical protein